MRESREAGESPGWERYLPEQPWRSLFVSLARARLRAAGEEGSGMERACSLAAEDLRLARDSPPPTADESATTDEELSEAEAELARARAAL